MRAMRCHSFDGPSCLRLDEVATPEPGPGQVRIKVAAVGLNFADILMTEGRYQEKPEPPFAPGLEVAGTIDLLSEGVSGFAPGRRALALVSYGGYADYALAEASDVFLLPDGLETVTAAGFPTTYGTAHGALVWRAGLREGETLLVHGAGGGVGLAAVEIGKALGAEVIATAGTAEKLALAKEHGAEAGIDYSREDIRTRVEELTERRGADVVFDPVGGSVFDASLRCVAWSGRIVVIGFASGIVPKPPANLILVKNLSILGLYWGSYRKQAPDLLAAQFRELFGWHAEGLIKPHLSCTLPLEEAKKGLDLLAKRQSTGKVVLTT